MEKKINIVIEESMPTAFLNSDRIYQDGTTPMYRDKDGSLCVVYFEATEKTLKILRYYNPVTVVTKVSR